MLTATYTLVALSVEQANVRISLQSLQKQLDTHFVHQQSLTPGQVGYACEVVKRLYDSYHWRKLDMFLIPAIRHATGEAEDLLRSLEELGRCAADAMGVLAVKLGATAIDNSSKVAQFCAAVEAFSTATLQRLELEEHQLFPVARSVISGEAWFSIANQMLAHDAYVQESRPLRQPPPSDEEGADRGRRRRAAAHLVH